MQIIPRNRFYSEDFLFGLETFIIKLKLK